jgi:uncharacterized protein YlxW (UPF0749 family)
MSPPSGPSDAPPHRHWRDLLRPHASTASVVVAVLLALLGFAAVTQVRATESDTAYEGARRQDLVLLIDSLDAATQRAQADLADLQRTRRSLQADTSAQRAVLRQSRQQLRVQGPVQRHRCGYVAQRGRGAA